MPGTGMCDPSRNTAMIATVNRIFLRRSGVFNALTKALSTCLSSLREQAGPVYRGSQDLDRTAGLLDLPSSRTRHGVHPNGEGTVQLPASEDLHRPALVHQPLSPEDLGRDLTAGLEP